MKFQIHQTEIQKLLTWYQTNKRDLPWRRTSDPYRIWISEIMLQQTRVEAVKKYYERFLSFLPTIKDLANVKEQDLMKLWEGLGYYSRARNLKKCAQEIIAQNLDTLPSSEEKLKKLPGIGPYTTGAILSIAYQKCYPALDGNVLRILSRVEEDQRDLLTTNVRKEYVSHLKKFMTPKNSRDFTEAFIELGALVCLPNGAPICQQCPFQTVCKSYKHQTIQNYPKKKAKKSRPKINKTVYVLKYQEKYMIQKRKEGLLKGLYEFPNIDTFFTKEELQTYLEKQNFQIKTIHQIGKFTHLFTHLEWTMLAYEVELSSPNHYHFYSKKKIQESYSLPSAFQKIFIKLK